MHWRLTFEGDQVGEKQPPDDPQRWAVAEVLGPLSSPGVEAKGTEPLVHGYAEGSDVEGDKNGDPQFGAEGHQEGQQRDLHLSAGKTRRWSEVYPGIKVKPDIKTLAQKQTKAVITIINCSKDTLYVIPLYTKVKLP